MATFFSFVLRAAAGIVMAAYAAVGLVEAAGTDPDDGQDDAEVVVSANRIATDVSKVGSSVTVITAADIERKQARTVLDVLRGAPGVIITQTGGPGRTAAVRLRGLEGYHVKVLIDGIDVGDPSAAQASFDFAYLRAENVERIEVLRGAQSLLYGSDAIGGVIAITTRKGKGAPKASALFEGGSRRSHTFAASAAGESGRINYALDLGSHGSDGISAASERLGNTERDPYKNRNVRLKFEARLLPAWSVEANGRFVQGEASIDGIVNGRPVDDVGSVESKQFAGGAATKFSLLQGRLSNRLGYSFAVMDRDYDLGLLGWGDRYTAYGGKTQTLDYQGTAIFNDAHRLVFGIEGKREAVKVTEISKSISSTGVFADYQLTPFAPLSLTFGGRFDEQKAFGFYGTWRTTAAYLIDATETRLHASAGTGFRAPSIYELYAPIYGNPHLKPEESRSWDLGIEQSFLDGRGNLDVTGFFTALEPEIAYDFAANAYANVGSKRAKGVEVSGRWALSQSLGFNGAYTFTDARNGETKVLLLRRPRHQGMLEASWRASEKAEVGASLRAVGAQQDLQQKLNGYALVDLRLSYELSKTIRFNGRIENLFDKSYEEAAGYGAPGRMFHVGVRASF